MTQPHGWNAIVTVRPGTYERARTLLARYGAVRPTSYLNVLTLAVDGAEAFLRRLRADLGVDPELAAILAHAAAADQTFTFQTAAQFRDAALRAVQDWLPRLAGAALHVRVRRRGFKGTLHSADEERALADAVLAALETRGTPASVRFDDPDAILVVETVDGRAAIALVTRQDRESFPFLDLS